jgi:hypothetical protein
LERFESVIIKESKFAPLRVLLKRSKFSNLTGYLNCVRN